MEDTIAAIATAYGEGGIGIVRISGENSKKILKRLFKPAYKNIESIVNRQLIYGYIFSPDSGKVVDEVLAVYMQAPATYTREDVVEIHCHGSIVSLRTILELVLHQGARLAEPGEFTKRAFLNGRIDLSQAEAVIDVVRAKTEKSFQLAMRQMEGQLSVKIRKIRNELMDVLVQLAVNIDYPDEDIEELTYEELIKSILQINDEIDKLIASAGTGRMIREGLRVTIVGKPNVGKSSLMNALLKEARAIVTEIPGTTRDTIEEALNLQGIPVYLTDTAGIHHTEDQIERIGIEKSREAFHKSDLVIFMVDGSEQLSQEDYDIAKEIDDKKVVVLINKSDLGKRISDDSLKQMLPQAIIINTAVVMEKGIKDLEEQIISLVYGGKLRQEQSEIVTNARHKDLLIKSKKSLKDALNMAYKKDALDFIEVDVRHTWELLGEILGETVSDDIINQVFERFCLGK